MPITSSLPLSAAQHGIWMGQQMDPANPAYWTAEAIELDGPLAEQAFESSLRDVLNHCDALHMRYTSDGQAVLQHRDRREDWALLRLDLSHEPDPWQAALSWLRSRLRQATDLSTGPLFGTALLKLAPDRHLWTLQAHHVALDGFGHALLAQAVAARYSAHLKGQAPTLPNWSLAAIVDEDHRYQGSPQAEHDLAFWRTRLANAAAPVTLAPPAAIARHVRRCHGGLDTNAFERCRQVSDAPSLDWAAWVLASVAAWLYRHTGQTDITLGLPVMNRLGSVALAVPCMAMNIVPLRLTVEPARSVYALAQQAAATLRAIRPHQRYRYEQLRHDLGRVGGHKRLFGPVLNLMPFDRPPAFGDLTAQAHAISAGPVDDLAITVVPGPQGLRLGLEANPNAYGEAALAEHRDSLIATIAQLSEQADTPLSQVLGPPTGQVPATQPVVLSGGPLPRPAEPVLQAWIAQARRAPWHPALEHDGQVLSHDELLTEVQAMAGRLAAHGVGPGSKVALLLPREPRTMIALLAVLWAGGCYVPLDLDGPPARRALVLSDAQPALLLTLLAHAPGLAPVDPGLPVLCLDAPACDAARPLATPTEVGPDALAYIIYTSGTTGTPNGVMVGRAALAHFLAGATTRYRFTASDRILQFAPLHFDASVEEIFLPLTTGATLVLRNDAMLASMPRLMAACAAHGITVLDLPTAFWHELAYSVAHGDAALPPSVRLVIIGGEAALAERVTRWRQSVPPHVVLLNTYGPTEATVICTTAELAGPGAWPDNGEGVPIGRPLPGMDLAVIDQELCLMGPALAQGYLGRQELNARRFVRLDALPGRPRAYRTGDRVQLGQDGQLRYLGRLDDEFKLGGHRIDPAEVEAALLAFPGIREAAAVGQVLPDGAKRLAAFLVSDQGAEPAALRAFLAGRLPAMAVPTLYAFLPRLPRNANNKIDRSALREQALNSEQDHPAIVATPLEHTVMSVWRAVLGAQLSLTPDSDFFALGSKSLQAIQVATRLGVALQREVPVSLLFQHPTVATLAQTLSAPVGHQPPPAAAGHELAPLLTIQSGQGPALFCVHPAEGLSWCYFGLSRQLPGMPIIGLQARGITGEAPATFEAMVDDYLALIRQSQPEGPYHLLGWSSGGGIAHALATRLRQLGAAVPLLAMMDAYPSDIWVGKPEPQERDALEAVLDVIGESPKGPDGQPLPIEALRAKLRQPGSSLADVDETRLTRLTAMALHSMRIYRGAAHERFDGDLLFFHALKRSAEAPDCEGWRPYVAGAIERIDIDSTHSGMSQPAPLSHIGRALAQRLGALHTARSPA